MVSGLLNCPDAQEFWLQDIGKTYSGLPSMLKQSDDENGKANLDMEPPSSPSASKRDSDEPQMGPERKRTRTDSAGEKGMDLLRSSQRGGESKLVIVLEDNSRGVLNLGVQLEVQSTGNETVGGPSKDDKAMRQPTPATGNKIVQAKTPKNAIVMTLSAEVAEDRGSRHTMEDAWVMLPQAWIGTPGKLRLAHFAIYDGHGGRHAAEYACAHLHANVLSAGLTRELMDIKGVKRASIKGSKPQTKPYSGKVLQEDGKTEQLQCLCGFLGKWCLLRTWETPKLFLPVLLRKEMGDIWVILQ